MTIFGGFWDFVKKLYQGIFLNFPKMCQKMILTFWQNFRQIYRLVLELSTKNRQPKPRIFVNLPKILRNISENFSIKSEKKNFFFFKLFFLNAKKITESEFFFFFYLWRHWWRQTYEIQIFGNYRKLVFFNKIRIFFFFF